LEAAREMGLVLRYVAEIKEESAPRLDWLGFLLSAVCLAALVSGFEAIGRDVMPLPALLGLIALGAACGLAYGWHARR
ncbi:MFS transporter, partial [Cupriavidus sp. SIMBA_020]